MSIAILFPKPRNMEGAHTGVTEALPPSPNKRRMESHTDTDDVTMAMKSLKMDQLRVLFVYDKEMEKHVSENEEYERPERHAVIVNEMVKSGLAARCRRISARLAKDAELGTAHATRYVAGLRKTVGASRRVCGALERKYENEVYVCGDTFMASRLALGSTIEVTKEALKCNIHAAACVRPPGHHACCERAMGFCFLNYVATAAKLAVDRLLSQRQERVLIVDW